MGAGGNIASEFVARSPADGYTILMGTLFLATNQSLYSKLTWDPHKDFAPISMVTASPLILCVHPSLPVKNTKELIALAKKRPGELNFPVRRQRHIHASLRRALQHDGRDQDPARALQGLGPGVLDLVSGRVQFMLNPMPEPVPFINAGKLRALATSTPNGSRAARSAAGRGSDTRLRDDHLAGIPGAGRNAQGHRRPAAHRIHQGAQGPEFASRMRGMGLEIAGTTPAEFAQFIRDENVKWAKVIKATGAGSIRAIRDETSQIRRPR